MNEHPLIQSLRILQRDLSAMKARVSEIQRQVATLSLGNTKQYPCPECAIPFPSSLKRDEHVYRVHDGPTPQHWGETAFEEATTSDVQRADAAVPAPTPPAPRRA